MAFDEEDRKARDGYISEIIARFRKREEWEILDEVRAIVEAIECRLVMKYVT